MEVVKNITDGIVAFALTYRIECVCMFAVEPLIKNHAIYGCKIAPILEKLVFILETLDLQSIENSVIRY